MFFFFLDRFHSYISRAEKYRQSSPLIGRNVLVLLWRVLSFIIPSVVETFLPEINIIYARFLLFSIFFYISIKNNRRDPNVFAEYTYIISLKYHDSRYKTVTKTNLTSELLYFSCPLSFRLEPLSIHDNSGPLWK